MRGSRRARLGQLVGEWFDGAMVAVLLVGVAVLLRHAGIL